MFEGKRLINFSKANRSDKKPNSVSSFSQSFNKNITNKRLNPNNKLSSKIAKDKVTKWQKRINDKLQFNKSKGSDHRIKIGNRGATGSPSQLRREIEQQSKSQEMIGNGHLQQGPYPININININNSKKE